VNVFPDQKGANGYPGTNFGNACGGSYYTSPDGKETRLLESCPLIGSDIEYCQAKGKKILLSLGGAATDVYIASESSAIGMADFLWGAFGPAKDTWDGPRPFGDVCVDGFDFDIESKAADITGPTDFGYATMVDHFRELFKEEAKTYYVSAAPQCIIPDSHLSDAISKSIFDFMSVTYTYCFFVPILIQQIRAILQYSFVLRSCRLGPYLWRIRGARN
jgi:chitinase